MSSRADEMLRRDSEARFTQLIGELVADHDAGEHVIPSYASCPRCIAERAAARAAQRRVAEGRSMREAGARGLAIAEALAAGRCHKCGAPRHAGRCGKGAA